MKYGSITTGIIADGLVFNIDAANRASTIPSTNTTEIFNTINISESGSMSSTGGYDSSTVFPTFDFDSVGGMYLPTDFNLGDKNTTNYWTKRTTVADTYIMGLGVGSLPYYLNHSNNGYIFFKFNNTDSSVGSFFSNSATGNALVLSNSQFVNFTFIRNIDICDLYVNGIFTEQKTLSSTSGKNSKPLAIGGGNGAGSFGYSGNIGPVQFYNRALSANEVLHNYNALKGRFGL